MRTVAFWLSLLLIFMIPGENMITTGSVVTTGARLVGILVAMFWVGTVISTGSFRKPHPFHIAVSLFVIWNVLSFFWSVDLDSTLTRLLTYVQLAVFVYILWDLFTSPAALKAGLQAYVLGAYVAIASTVGNYLADTNASTLRYAATGFNVNDLGLSLALGIPVAWHLATSGSEGKSAHVLRAVNYAYLPAAVLAILLTASRGALIASSVAFLFVLATATRLKIPTRVLIFTIMVGAFFALQPNVPQSSLRRLATTATSIANGDLGGRVDIWLQGLAVFSEHPLLGIGSGAFRLAVELGKSAHSSYLSVMVEVGMIGFALLVILVGIAVYQAVRHPKWDARFWLATLLVLALGNSVHNWVDQKATWLFLSLVVVSANLLVPQAQSRLRSEYQAKFFRTSNLSDFRRKGQPMQNFREPGLAKPRLDESKIEEGRL